MSQADEEQVAESVSGAAIDAQKYLDKFLKFTFRLPEKTLEEDRNNRKLSSIAHFDNLVSKSKVLNNTGLKLNPEMQIFAHALIKHNELSLREVETFIRYLEVYNTFSHGQLGERYVLGYLLLRLTGVFIYGFKSDIKDTIQKNKTDANEIAVLFKNLCQSPNPP
ncbi:P-loop NTPase fold protein [Neisseria iguanae]|uniref:Uncharacterized protein n=1 Tax=Neisseria iguanae TaxID=90242 RepID=A0A2P7TY87_9NEIS|nr:P-loop NTPase fold protein [Neisseria iguanae]PSJ79690.1 hypothetical protein C7N83_10740 [Neisseria iguanae]